MTKKLVLRIFFWSVTIGIMIVVFLNSAKNATQSSELSVSFTEQLFSVFIPDYEAMDEASRLSLVTEMQFLIRKSAHFLSYFAMSLFCILAFNTYNLSLKSKFLFSSATCIAFSVSDEIHQLFVPGRSGEIRDVLIDTAGILLAAVIVSVIIYLRKLRKEKKNEKGF
jgi:VanZ family protein